MVCMSVRRLQTSAGYYQEPVSVQSDQRQGQVIIFFDSRGDPAIVYLDGVKPPSPVSSPIALIPDKVQGTSHLQENLDPVNSEEPKTNPEEEDTEIR